VKTVLLILRDAPRSDIRKSGLYLGQIRQHVAAGLDVHVCSLTPMRAQDGDTVRALGATPLTAEMVGVAPWIGGLRGLQRRLRGKSLRPSEWMATPAAMAHIRQHVRPSIVMGLQAYQTGMMAQRIAAGLGVPYGTFEDISCYRQGRPLPWDDAVFREFFGKSHVTVCVSDGIRQAICDRFDIALPQARIIPNPVPQGFERRPGAALPGLAEFRGDNFLFAGWTNWRALKRPDVLIRAFDRLHARYPATRLFMAGPVEAGTEDLVRELGVGDSVRLAGNLSREDIWKLAHGCDCCCLSSDFETFGLSMIEALAAGKPVVATQTDGPRDVLKDEDLGVLSPVGDADALAEAMEKAYLGRDRFDSDVIAAKALSRYGEDALSRRWKAIYDDETLSVSGQ
jgi:glycosyltransferase involved in cell wall biosynthesis